MTAASTPSVTTSDITTSDAASPTRTRPANWYPFINQLGETGKVGDAAEQWFGSRSAHTYYIADEELRKEYDKAYSAGLVNTKKARVHAVLAEFGSGVPLAEAVKVDKKMSVGRFYQLCEETDLVREYERVRDSWTYKGSIPFLLEQLELDSETTDDGPALAAISKLKAIVELCNISFAELEKTRGTVLRDTILREIGAEYEDEDGFPPFLQM